MFYPWKQVIEVAGSINNFKITPLIYKIKDIRENKETGFINIKYKNNLPIIESAFPHPNNDTRREQVSQELLINTCLLYTSPSPRDRTRSRMPSSA